MYLGMKSVMVFDPKDGQEKIDRKWEEWHQQNSNKPTGRLLKPEKLKD